MKIKFVVFDMDGVILDSMGPLTDLAVRTIAYHFGLKEAEARKQYLSTVGVPFFQQLEILFPKEEETRVKAIFEYEEEHRKLCPTLPLAKDARAVVDELKSSCQVALVTSTHKLYVMDQLKQVRSLGFDFLGGYRPNENKAYQIGAAMGLTGHSPDDTIFFGDSEIDAFYASQTGVSFRMVTCENLSSVLTHVVEVKA